MCDMDRSVIFTILFVFLVAVCISMECEYSFEFPAVNASVFNVEENSNISLQFVLLSTCGLPDDFRINVEKMRATVRAFVCQILHVNGTCFVHTSDEAQCECLSDNGTYLLSKEAQRNDNTTWIWRKAGDNETETELVFNIIDADTKPSFTSETTKETTVTSNAESEPETFRTENVAIVSAIAGFVVLAIFAIILVCVKTGRGKTDTEVEMTHQERSDSPPHDMYPGHRRTQYCELTWENVQPGQGRNLTTEGMRTRRESATPYAVVQVAPSRSIGSVSEDIYHEVGNTVIVHASQGDQSERPLPPPPDLDPDGYMTPRPATH